jgi:hypothetical protein
LGQRCHAVTLSKMNISPNVTYWTVSLKLGRID